MMKDTYLITREEIDAMEGLEKTHFLNPNAKRVNKSLGDKAGLSGFGFHIIEVEPAHESTEHHLHYHEDECIYVLGGTATAYIGEDSFEIKAGDFIGYRKGGLAHSITNNGQEIFRCIVVGERKDHDVGDYTRLQKRIYRNKDMEWNLVDLASVEKPKGGAKA